MAEYTKNILRKEGRPDPRLGPKGQISVDLGDIDNPPTLPCIGWILFNYNIDGNLPKEEHKEYLRRHLVPFMQMYKVHLRIVGMTSASGKAKYNKQLSLERILLLKEYLTEKCHLSGTQVAPTDPERDAEGETRANQADPEDMFDRAVRLELRSGRLRIPVRIKRRLPRPTQIPIPMLPFPEWKRGPDPDPLPNSKATNRFQVRYCSGWEGTVGGVGYASHCFQIRDPATGETGTFLMETGVISAGTPVSVSMAGPTWHDLELGVKLDLDDFDRRDAAFDGFGGGPKGYYRIEFPEIPPKGGGIGGANTTVSTGFTVGVGISSVVGPLKRVP